jgi:hypothetical protein
VTSSTDQFLSLTRRRKASARHVQCSSHALSANSREASASNSSVSMDNGGFSYSQNLPNGNPDITFDRFWAHYDGQLPPLNEAYPSQSAPFFQFSGYEQKPLATGPPPTARPQASQIHTPQTVNPSYQPDAFDLAQRQSARPAPTSRTQPSNKRQKIALRAQAMELIYYKRRLGEATEDRLQDQKVSAVVAALTESLAPARTALRVVNLAATARQLKLYRVTRKLASSQLALTSVSALAFKTSRHCSTKASCQGSK